MLRPGLGDLASLVRDAASLSLGSILGAALTFLVWVFLARALPADAYGALGAAFAFVALFQLFGDWGINYLVIREGARDRTHATDLFRDLLGLKLALLGAATAVCAAAAVLVPFRTAERYLIFAYLATLPVAGFAAYLASLCNVHRRIMRLAAVQFGERGAYAAFTPLLVAAGLGVAGAALAAVASAAIYVGLAAVATRPLRSGPLWPPAHRSAWRPHVGAAFQFGLAAILATVQQRIDVVLLAVLSDPTSLSRYVAALQVFFLLLLLSSGFAQAIFPWLVPRLHRGEVSLRRLATWCGALGVLALGIAAAAYAAAPAAFPVLFGPELGQSAAVFRVLVWAFVPALAGAPAALALDALNLQKFHVANTAVMAGIAIALNVAWIPSHGAFGAAWAAVASWGYGLVVGLPIAFVVLRRHGLAPSQGSTPERDPQRSR